MHNPAVWFIYFHVCDQVRLNLSQLTWFYKNTKAHPAL